VARLLLLTRGTQVIQNVKRSWSGLSSLALYLAFAQSEPRSIPTSHFRTWTFSATSYGLFENSLATFASIILATRAFPHSIITLHTVANEGDILDINFVVAARLS